MNWIAPLGLLGLLGIAILILIYILKPNYQQKIISSTHVWKLSLKYRKRRIPINKFRNILIFLCQVLIITISAFILTQPFIAAETEPVLSEKIAIIDASASMQAIGDGKTRFERAVSEARALGKQTIEQQGQFTVILAGKEASFVTSRTDSLDLLNEALDDLVRPNETACTFGRADIDGSMTLAEEILNLNPKSEVLLYTATEYADAGNVTIKDVSLSSEWNAAILDCKSELVENYYIFSVDLATYGRDKDLLVHFTVEGTNDIENDDQARMRVERVVRCFDGETVTISFDDLQIFAYRSVHVYIEEDDSFSYDNSFYLYGGTKDTIRIQYYSPLANDFFSGVLLGLENILKPRWNIDRKEVKGNNTPQLEGFDFYIFEHKMPEVLPTDGVVFLVNPDVAPKNSGIVLGNKVTENFVLGDGQPHNIMNNVTPSNITVSEYTRVTLHDGYVPLMFCGGDPVLLLKDTPDEKIAVLSFSLNRSNLAVLFEFPVLLYNMFNHFIPSTLTEYVYDVDQSVNVNSRGPVLNVSGPGLIQEYDSFPNVVSAPFPGAYTLTQTPISGIEVIDNFYVKVAAVESDFSRVEERLSNPFIEVKKEPVDLDLLIYLAAALVLFLFAEWWLQTREQF